MIKKINHLLKQGYHIDRNKAREKKIADSSNLTIPTLEDCIQKYEAYCTNIKKNSPKEVREKKNALIKLSVWMKENYGIFYLSEITPKIAQRYFDDLLMVDGVGAKTFNNTLGRIRTFYSTSKKREWIGEDDKNPFKDVERQSVHYGEKNPHIRLRKLSK